MANKTIQLTPKNGNEKRILNYIIITTISFKGRAEQSATATIILQFNSQVNQS